MKYRSGEEKGRCASWRNREKSSCFPAQDAALGDSERRGGLFVEQVKDAGFVHYLFHDLRVRGILEKLLENRHNDNLLSGRGYVIPRTGRRRGLLWAPFPWLQDKRGSRKISWKQTWLQSPFGPMGIWLFVEQVRIIVTGFFNRFFAGTDSVPELFQHRHNSISFPGTGVIQSSIRLT